MSMAAVREHALWEGGGAGRGVVMVNDSRYLNRYVGNLYLCFFNLHRKILLLGKLWAGLGLFA